MHAVRKSETEKKIVSYKTIFLIKYYKLKCQGTVTLV